MENRTLIIKQIAEHWHGAIFDFENLNDYLYNNYGFETNKEEVAKLLNYI